MSKELITKSLENTVLELNQIINQCSPIFQNSVSNLLESIKLAQGRLQIQKTIMNTPELKNSILALQDSPIGFLSDKKDKGGYDEKTVIECAVEAMLRGLYLHNNEFNIIAGRFYQTVNGCFHQLQDNPQLKDLQTTLMVPEMKPNGALVTCSATWTLNGEKKNIGIEENDPCIIPIKVNNFMGSDAVLGKARRKLLARILERVTGNAVADGDANEAEPQEMKIINPIKETSVANSDFEQTPPPPTEEPETLQAEPPAAKATQETKTAGRPSQAELKALIPEGFNQTCKSIAFQLIDIAISKPAELDAYFAEKQVNLKNPDDFFALDEFVSAIKAKI
jgi:hypothetical protein